MPATEFFPQALQNLWLLIGIIVFSIGNRRAATNLFGLPQA
jgi:hypothetical protein